MSNIDWKLWLFYFLLSEFYLNGKKEERNNFVYSKSFVYQDYVSLTQQKV